MVEGRSHPPLQPGDPRLIMRWAQRYAKSRTISFLVQWVFIVLMLSGIGLMTAIAQMAQQTGNGALFNTIVFLMGFSIVLLVWFSISPWGGEVIWRITQWLYGKEGYVASEDDQGPSSWWVNVSFGGLIIYHVVLGLLISFEKLPVDSLHFWSALYMVPFLMIMIVYQHLGFWAWIWPVCYGLHAAGAYLGYIPMIQGQWQLANSIIPALGYGFVAMVAGHLYSRFALYKLRSLARASMPANPDASDDDEGGA